MYSIIMFWIEKFSHDPTTFFIVTFILSTIHVFIPPIPIEGSLALLTGYLARTHHSSIILIWVAMTSGTSAGSILLYLLAKTNGKRWLNWRFIKAQLNSKSLKTAQNWFQHYGVWIIFPGKCIPGMNFVAIFCCGLFNVKHGEAILAICISNGLYYSGLVLLSKYFGRKWDQLSNLAINHLPWISLSILILFSLAIVFYLHYRLNHKKP
jgi:membrane protein DedA with SNARE-associated domain